MNEGRIVQKGTITICAKDQPTRSCPSSSTPSARDREFMNRIRKAGKAERFESKHFTRFLVSWLPDFLLILSCVPAFLINSSSAADVVIVPKNSRNRMCPAKSRTHPEPTREFQRNTQGMGGTIILWEALRGGQIDAYPEYREQSDGDFKDDSHPIVGSNSEFARKSWCRHDGSAGFSTIHTRW